MTVKQSETDTFNPEGSSNMLDASLDAIIASTGHVVEGTGTPRPMTKTPTPSNTPAPQSEDGPAASQTLLGLGGLGLPVPRSAFPVFERKPAADDPEEDAVSLADPLAAQAAAHRDRALGRLPGIASQPETPPPPSAAAGGQDVDHDSDREEQEPDPGLTPPPPSMPLGFGAATISSVDLPVHDEEIEDEEPDPELIAAGRAVRSEGSGLAALAARQEEREVRSADLEFEEPDDGPTSLNPEIGQALEDADFFPNSFAAPRPNELSAPLFPTGAPRSATAGYPRLVTPPPAEEIPAELPPFNLTLPPPGRPPGANTPSSLPSLGSSQLNMPTNLGGGLSLPSGLAARGFTRNRLLLGGGFVVCILAGVLIDKALSHDGQTPPPPSLATTPTPEPVIAAPTPAPPAIVPVQPAPPAAVAEPVKPAPPVHAKHTAPTEPAPPKTDSEIARAPRPAAAARPPVAPPPLSPESVAARPAPLRAAAAPKPTTPVKPPARPAARPKTKWVDPFAP